MAISVLNVAITFSKPLKHLSFKLAMPRTRYWPLLLRSL